MQVVELKPRRFELAEGKAADYLKTEPKESDVDEVVPADRIFMVDGEVAGFSKTLEAAVVEPIRHALQTLDFQSTYRTEGLKTTSRVIGYQPRIPVRRDFCTAAALAKEAPAAHAILCAGAVVAGDLMKMHCTDQWARQNLLVSDRIKPHWRIPGSFFTSGICNRDNPLRYHFDSGNLPGTWNAMLCLRKDITGGHLAVPQLGVAFAVTDATLIVFNAQGYLHGVLPFKKQSPRGYRYTVVYYALNGMCHCGTAAEELERIRRVKTEREQRRRAKT